MGSQKQFLFNSKEDQTLKISKSVFVTNFPEYFTSCDLWKVCSDYGSVIDVFIPYKKSKVGKKFTFVRFIKVVNLDRVIENLCTIWIGRLRLHVNVNVKSSHLGGLWVIIDLVSCASKEKFFKHVGVCSWFEVLKPACNSFVCEEQIVWLSIEGLPLKVWSHNTFVKIASKWGELVDMEDYEDASFSHKRLCLRTKSDDLITEKFKVIVQGKKYWLRAKEMEAWTPDFHDKSSASSFSDDESLGEDEGQASDFKKQEYATDDDKEIEKVSETKFDYEQVPVHNLSQEEVQSEDPCNMNKHSEDEEEVQSENPCNMNKHSEDENKVNVGQSLEEDPKYPPGFTPVQNEVEKGVAQGVNNFDDLISSNSRNMDDSRSSKGAMSKRSANLFSKVHNRGSFLDVLDELVKVGQIMGYNMEGCLNNIEAIIGSQGDGDFNEVHAKHERFGFSFSHQGAHVFNNFISSSSLYDIPLGGYSFTWAHKSASKMSKLDRFLVTEGLMLKFPHLAAICLDKNLSDHRPILMRELNVDYEATPFRVFHSWFNMKGFDNVVKNSWKNSNFVEANGMIYFKKKLQILKQDIKSWSKETRNSSLDAKLSTQKKLSYVDKVLDQGGYSDDTVNYRDENFRYFHVILNKKRSQLAIHKGLADGEWLVDPSKVNDLERPTSYDEIKRAVWECGTNKSQSPDGFTFDFFRRYWSLIDHDVVNAVTYFLPQ
nr:RNA-directed DNA polymerase, eukaryota [Tanacetum cinerariifolium]